MRRVLVARLDNAGDVLLAGPLVRAIGQGRNHVVLLCSPRGEPAAALLPRVARIEVFDAPWISLQPDPVSRPAIGALVERLRALELDEAVIATSDHQSPLPLALVLRLADVERIGAISPDYPGALLDVRHRVPDDLHEVERNLSLAEACGHRLPPGDDGRLSVQLPTEVAAPVLGERYVVVHPGASTPARTWHPEGFRALTAALVARGRTVVVTGSRSEEALTASVAGDGAVDLGGRLTFPELAAVLRDAGVVVVGNTGPAHLAAAVGTPVVSIFPPTVPLVRWRPWSVPHRVLGDQAIECRGCRSRTCPRPGHPCVGTIPVREVLAAIDDLEVSMPEARRRRSMEAVGR